MHGERSLRIKKREKKTKIKREVYTVYDTLKPSRPLQIKNLFQIEGCLHQCQCNPSAVTQVGTCEECMTNLCSDEFIN